ncbi:cell division protein FtsQ/DivIB [Pseudoroseicyclus aestuarii]|uniref:Cell division protein FtsQ n=1 Tax=Pseudoroseicyclus aestuarii TaxID=1795041 RepID=A0A318STL3_9RHOB|nr:cell division protein FtsQ/DivIB [Pseudoroseicyclus aestuarii]PYE82519.1 cell division protein FtsQ [Pseudoroseicyclus aestuarii]
MRSLIPRLSFGRQPDFGVPRDPAPSRWRYRLQRLMLTPAFRLALRIGLPMVISASVTAAWLSVDGNRQAVLDGIEHAKRTIQQRPEFMVTTLEIDGAEPALDSAIRGYLPQELPVSSWDLDLVELRAGIRELTAVEDVVLRVRPGGTLAVHVTPRTPVAVWRNVDGLRLVDGSGVMTGMIRGRSDRADLPLIAGDGAREHIDEALALFAAAEPISARVRGLVRMGERRWDMVLDGGLRILLPTEQPVAALDRVLALNQAEEVLSRDIVAVDMRNGHRPTVRMSEPALVRVRRAQDETN